MKNIIIEFTMDGTKRVISARSKEGRRLTKEHARLHREMDKLKLPTLLALLHEKILLLMAVMELLKRRKLPEKDVRSFYRKMRLDSLPVQRHMRVILEWCWHHEVKAVKFDRLKPSRGRAKRGTRRFDRVRR